MSTKASNDLHSDFWVVSSHGYEQMLVCCSELLRKIHGVICERDQGQSSRLGSCPAIILVACMIKA